MSGMPPMSAHDRFRDLYESEGWLELTPGELRHLAIGLDYLVERYTAALEQIAAPKRPDGTYNLSREACEQIAREAMAA